MRVPASVLLAVLAAAGLLALAPALVRRYDATERLAAERAQSTARVLQRRRRRRSVPGRQPLNPPRGRIVTLRSGALSTDLVGAEPVSPATGPGVPVSGPPGNGRRSRRLSSVPRNPGRARRRPPPGRHTPAVYRRRRVFAALLLLNLVELIGVMLVSSGFWISFSVTGTLLAAYLVHLRGRAVAERRRRRAEAREAAWLAARQAEVRRAQARRAQARREAQRRLAAQREAVRRAALDMNRLADLPPAASGGGGRAAGSVSYRRAGGLRGRPYEAGGR
ncbi:hypothetical protein ACN27G_34805 [Plantactinospora sp. WMMB334]|uniref:divisome protein SepX/GlpR n=1 Tax=Plantactinospora sp. WMMB334 TaxID=3404119 RepID=UPI003B964EDE